MDPSLRRLHDVGKLCPAAHRAFGKGVAQDAEHASGHAHLGTALSTPGTAPGGGAATALHMTQESTARFLMAQLPGGARA